MPLSNFYCKCSYHLQLPKCDVRYVCVYVCMHSYIQGVPGRKAYILGGHSIGHFKQIMYMYMCPIPNGFRDRAISLYSSKTVDKKEILRTVSNFYFTGFTAPVGRGLFFSFMMIFKGGRTPSEASS
jgi:hypothetical protein